MRGDILRNSLGEKKQFGGERKGKEREKEEKKRREGKQNQYVRKKKKIEGRKERAGRALFDFRCFDGRKSIG